MIALAFAHKDIDAAARLLGWMGFLGGLESERCLLVVSPAASKLERMRFIADIAPKVFASAYVHVPAKIDERGWPIAPNSMFRETLLHMEKHFPDEPILWIEPDAEPVTKDWFARLKNEYAQCGKPFMGAYVPHGTNHMTGNAWYAANWRSMAPMLAMATTEAWDTYAAPQVIPRAHFTKQIQHIFNNPIIQSLSVLAQDTVLFHQDKTHQLIRLLDKERFGGRFFLGQEDLFEHPTMTKYYHTLNATRPLKAMGYEFKFAGYSNAGGVWRGVLESSLPAEQVVLDGLAVDPRSGITEIPEAEYLENVKKKPGVKGTSPVFDPKLPLQAQTVENRVRPAVVSEPLPELPQSPMPLPSSSNLVEVGEVAPPDQQIKPRRRKSKEH